MPSYVFRYQEGDRTQEVPLTIDNDTQTIEVKWPKKTVSLSFIWGKWDVMYGSSSGESLGPGGDQIEVSPMGDVTYRCMGSGVPYVSAYKGKILFCE